MRVFRNVKINPLCSVRFLSTQKPGGNVQQSAAPEAGEDEANLDWEDLLQKFKGSEKDGSDEFGAFNDEDMNIFNQSRYNFDAANPPKLHVYHYNALQKVNPALYEEWVSLRTINWKLQNQLRPLGKIPFKADDVKAYDNIPMWDKPLARPRKSSCWLCSADTSEDKENQVTFTNLTLLHKLLNERGMIIGRRVSGLCGPHQRKAGKAIKRARLAGLLSLTSNWKIPESQLPAHVTGGDNLPISTVDPLAQYLEYTKRQKA